MKAVIHNISDISDSREILEAKPHPVVSILVYILLIVILTALTWSYFGEIDDYVRANGVVRPNEKLSSIRNKVDGKVEAAYLEEGKFVRKGDVLFTIEHTELDLQKDTVKSELQKAKMELENLKKFRQCIIKGKNYFNKEIDNEKLYYNKYLKYIMDLEVQSKQVELDSGNLEEIKETIESLNLLKKSIQTGENLIPESNSLYSSQYDNYEFSVKKLENVIKDRTKAYDNAKILFNSGASSKKEMDDLRQQINDAELDLAKYKSEFMLNIDTEIDKNAKMLKELQINLKSYLNDSMEGKYNEVSMQKYRMDNLVQIDNNIEAVQKTITDQETELKNLDINIKDCKAVAPIDGVISIKNDINKGDLLPVGTEVADIVPGTNSKYKVQLYVSNADIANLKEGQTIKYHFLALPYREYGELQGVIEKIGTDAKVDQQNGTSYYLVEASIENKPLYSYKGTRAEVKVGMACEAQVVVRSKKVLFYLLEMLNLKE